MSSYLTWLKEQKFGWCKRDLSTLLAAEMKFLLSIKKQTRIESKTEATANSKYVHLHIEVYSYGEVFPYKILSFHIFT
jgi:hypothetical protein